MILAEGQDLVLGGVTYPAVRFLGAGAIAEVYGSQLDGQAVAIKLLGSEPQSGVRFEPDSKEAAQLRHEADVLWQLNAAEVSAFASLNVAQERERSAYKADASDVRRVLLARVDLAHKTARDRVIVALLDRGQDDAGRPWLVEEMAPPAVEAKAVQGPTDELRMLEVMWRVAIGMTLAHANQYALSPDFALDTKADRIRVRWHGDTPEVRLIDWNITGGPDLFAKDLVYFGGHFYQLLLGRRLELNGDDRPLQAPGMGSSVWSILSDGTRGLLERLLHPDPRRRYGTAVELRDDLEWLVQVYKLAHPAVQSGKLRERAIATLTQRRYDRLAAVCDLALRGQLSEDDRRAFQTLQEEARRGLAQASPALSKIRISLGSGSYKYAALDAERELEYLDPRSEQARQLRYIRLLAQMGQAMREQGILDPGQTREWSALERGIQHLSNWAPLEAEEQFRLVAVALPALAKEGPLQALLNLARAYQSFAQANELVARTEPRPEDARRPDWLEVEKAQLDLLQQVVTLLEEARRLAPDEPYISDAWRFRREKLAQREAQFDLMERAEKALAREDYEGAEMALREVLAQNPQHARAQHLFAPAERRARFEALFKEAQLLMNEGRYREAQAALTQAQARVPDDPRLQPALKQAEVGAAVQRRVELALNRCTELVRTDVRRARDEVNEVARWPGCRLHELAVRLRLDVALAESEALPTFVLQPDLAQQLQQVQERIEATEIELVEAALGDAEELWRRTCFSEARNRLQQQADLAHGGQIAAIKALDQRLEECLKVEKEMLEKVSAWSAQLAAQMADTTVRTITTSLSEYLTGIAANPNLPDTVKPEARRLAEAVRSFFSQPDQSPDLRDMVQGTWAPHVQAVELMRELFAASLSIRAASAHAAGRSEDVDVLLDRKRRLKNLSLEEEKWKAEAEADIWRRKEVLESQKKAREHLEAARTGIADGQRKADDVQEGLRRALSALRPDDTSEEANTIRREVASVWRQLARAQTEFERANGIARAGAESLRPFGLAAGLDADFVLLQRAIEINQQTSTYFEAAPEFWDTTAPEQLPQLGAGLRALQNPERSWPILQDWARQREQWVAECLAKQLETLIGQARDARQQYRFEEALKLTSKGQRLLPEGVWRDRGDLQEKWKALEAIREAVQPVLKARQDYEDVIKDLEEGRLQLGTPEAAQRIESLKADPDDPKLAGLTRLKDLQEQARLTFAKPGPEKNHAFMVSECLSALKAISKARINSDDPLDRLAAQQEESLKGHITGLVEDLAIALEREVQQLTEGIRSESTQLASLYWQARWIWSVLPEDVAVPDVAQSLEKSLRTVDGLPGLLLSSRPELWKRVVVEGDRSAAKQAEDLIANLLTWCRSLMQGPVSTDLPPTLPARREWSKTEGFTTDNALSALSQLRDDLKMLNTPAQTIAEKKRQLEALGRVRESYRRVIEGTPKTL